MRMRRPVFTTTWNSDLKMKEEAGVVAHTIIPVLGRWRQDDCEFKVSLGYISIPYLKN